MYLLLTSMYSIIVIQTSGNGNIGISRLKSGSHTMSYYMSHQFENANTPSDMKFVTLGSFKNLREGIGKSIYVH